jgi:hypothetical protein
MDESRREVVALLVAAGVDLTAPADGGATLQEFAWQFGYGKVVDAALAKRWASSKSSRSPATPADTPGAEAGARNAGEL